MGRPFSLSPQVRIQDSARPFTEVKCACSLKYACISMACVAKKSLYLSVRVFSTVVLIVDTVNKQTNIRNRIEIC